jgi:presenilin-like A22 family membrane protease
MKHTLAVTLILVAVFFVSQIVGLAITSQYISQRIVNETTGEVINISYAGLPLDMQRPEVDESQSYLFILGAVLIGTVLVLLLIKFKGFKLWKMWFFLSVALCLTISFYAFTRQIFPATWPSFIPSGLALALAITLATLKIYKPNFIIHNLSEVFIYGGLAAIFVPIMNVYAVVILLYCLYPTRCLKLKILSRKKGERQ